MDPTEQYTQAQADTIWPLLVEALAGKTWEGKEKVLAAYPLFIQKSRCFWPDEQKGKEMKMITLRVARLVRPAYRPHAIRAMGRVARAREDLELSADAIPILRQVVEELAAGGNEGMDIDAGAGADQHLRQVMLARNV